MRCNARRYSIDSYSPLAFVVTLPYTPRPSQYSSVRIHPLALQSELKLRQFPKRYFSRPLDALCAKQFDADSSAAYDNMSTADLQKKLKDLGVSYADCFEKHELQSRLKAVKESIASKISIRQQMLKAGGLDVKLIRLRCEEGSLGSDVQIDERCHYAVKLRLTENAGRLFMLPRAYFEPRLV